MRRRWIRFAVPALLLTSGLALAFSTGPPASVTGATAVGAAPAEGNCRTCHTGNSLNVGGSHARSPRCSCGSGFKRFGSMGNTDPDGR